MKVNASIFRDYDIRGIAGKEFSKSALAEYEKWYGKFPGITITPEVAVALGKAYGTVIRKSGGKDIVIGHELRPYGKELKEQFIEGVLSTGCNIFDAGETLTPIVYFATAYYKFDGGVNVTGSHNVYFFNGFKMMKKDVFPLFGDEIQEMKKMIEEGKFLEEEKGTYQQKDAYQDYRKVLLENNKLEKKVKVVVDCGNGSAGKYAPKLLRDMGCEVVELYTEPDSSFPNHVPDPEDPEMLKDLIEKVKETKADIGIGLDADGDRCGVVDENGKFVVGDRMLILLAKDILSRNPGKKILYDVKCTDLIDKFIPEFGGVPLMHRTGHAPIKQTMRTDSAVIFGGEISGHFYFVENYFKIDDGVYAAAFIVSLLSKSGKTLSGMLEFLPETVITPELKLPCEDSIKHAVVDKIKKVFMKKYKTIDIDGVRVVFSDTSWGLVRASNTSPYLTIRVEAETKDGVIKIKNLLADELENYSEIGDTLDRKHVTSRTGKLGWR